MKPALSTTRPSAFAPASRLTRITPYRSAGATARAREDLLDLSANEGRSLHSGAILQGFLDRKRLLAGYPSPAPLEALLAASVSLRPDRLMVTAGADDALWRAALVALQPGRTAITTAPTFEMIPRYIALAGGCERSVPWMDGPPPVEAIGRAADASVTVVFIVSPNNPTGSVITADELRAIRAAAPDALLVLDLAYEEFAEEPLTAEAVRLPRTVVTRTFSKAWGMAGLRVGYAAAEAEVIDGLRRAGNPYPVSGVSLLAAERAMAELRPAMEASVSQARSERTRLGRLLRERRITVLASQANFVLARFGGAERASEVFRRLLTLGVLVRAFPAESCLSDSLRLTCPCDESDFQRLAAALNSALDDD